MMQVAVGYINYEPIPKFPGVSRDIAMEVKRDMPSSELLDIIHENGEDILKIHLYLMCMKVNTWKKVKISSHSFKLFRY